MQSRVHPVFSLNQSVFIHLLHSSETTSFETSQLNRLYKVKMNHFQTFWFFFPFISYHIVYGSIDCVKNDDYCTFYNISTNETHPLFNPSYINRLEVEKIDFINSKMQILTSELCETFPFLAELILFNCSLNQIIVLHKIESFLLSLLTI